MLQKLLSLQLKGTLRSKNNHAQIQNIECKDRTRRKKFPTTQINKNVINRKRKFYYEYKDLNSQS